MYLNIIILPDLTVVWENGFVCQNILSTVLSNVLSTDCGLATLFTLLPKFSELRLLLWNFINWKHFINSIISKNLSAHTKFNKIAHKAHNDGEIDISNAPVKRRSMAPKHDVSKKAKMVITLISE